MTKKELLKNIILNKGVCKETHSICAVCPLERFCDAVYSLSDELNLYSVKEKKKFRYELAIKKFKICYEEEELMELLL